MLDRSHHQQMLPNSRNMPKHGKEQREGLPWGCWPDGSSISGRLQLVPSGALQYQRQVAEMWECEWTLPSVLKHHLNNTVKHFVCFCRTSSI